MQPPALRPREDRWRFRVMTNLLAIIPLAFVMVAGPQIVSATLLATSESARRASLSYILGVASATTLGVAIVYVVAKAAGASPRSSQSSSGNHTVEWLIVALLLVLIVRVFLTRKTVEPPKWMSRLQRATPKFAITLGFALFILMPTDVITEITVGSYLAAHHAEFWKALPFIGLTTFLVALPLLILLLLGKRGAAILPKARDWMNEHSWIISEVVLLFFLAITLKNLL